MGMSPFKALYGQDCLVPFKFADPNLPVLLAAKPGNEGAVGLPCARAPHSHRSLGGGIGGRHHLVLQTTRN